MARKKKSTYTIAVDVGYGYTQAMDSDGNEDMQLSAYCHAPAALQGEELTQAQNGYESLTLYEPDGTLLLGNMAAAHAPSGDRLIRLSGRDNTHAGNRTRATLVKMAAARLLAGEESGDVVHAELVTGLPVNYLRDRNALKAALQDKHRIITDAADFTLNVTAVRIMPQPLGTVYAYRVADTGAPADFPYNTVVAFDFGTLTAQVATHASADTGDGRGFIPSRSFSVDAGAHIIQEALYNYVEAEFGSKDLPLARINKAIKTGWLRVMGDDWDVREVVNLACDEILTIIQRRAGATIGRALEADVVLVSGGIAPLMHPHIADVYGQARTFLADNPQWANVRGYMNFSLATQASR